MSNQSQKESGPSASLSSGTAGKLSSGGSRMGMSSQNSYVQSNIDTSDVLRIGGPGRLQRWPVVTSPPQDINQELSDAVLDIAISHMVSSRIDCRALRLCTRVVQGYAPTPDDTTLLIECSFDGRRDTLVSLLNTLLTVLPEIGYLGRVEIIDPRAIEGIQSFTPRLSQEQEKDWEDTLKLVIEALEQSGADWRQVFAANRGYFKDVSKPTVVVKVSNITPERLQMNQLRAQLSEHSFDLEIMDTGGLWGLFSSHQDTVLREQINTSLGWPFPPDYHSMGLSIGRNQHETSTLGGYLKVRHGEAEGTLGITCYHGVRFDSDGSTDEEIQSRGAVGLSWPCQSPSQQDIGIILNGHLEKANRPTPPNTAPHVMARTERKRQESTKKVEEVRSFNPFIGNVIAVSGWRNRQLGTRLDAPFVLIDWACVELSKERCPNPTNDIMDFGEELPGSFPESLPHWKTSKSTVDSVAEMPRANIVVFKRGRTTGVTAGELGGICPEAHRIPGLPVGLHHRGYVVFLCPNKRPFGLPGDSGAWCLEGNGDVVGQLIGGDRGDGTGLLIPFSMVIDDMELKLGLKPGSLSLP
ncbi:hypothetical protein BJX76DRAFT_369357 [Aspergillus varians]